MWRKRTCECPIQTAFHSCQQGLYNETPLRESCNIGGSRLSGIARTLAIMVTAILFLPAASPIPSGVKPIKLSMPIDCTLGDDCFIQNYVDMDPGEDARDFTCGPLAYNNHQGTDFRLRNRSALHKPYAALATAPGKVVQVINNRPDHGFEEGAYSSLDCGNGVMIDHGDGWMSQYCHLAEGSVRVTNGQTVQSGQPIGLVGSSGGTSFPHLHYAIRIYNATIDPFVGVSPTGCDAAEAEPLWDAAATDLFYAESAILGFGATASFPNLEAMENGALATPPSGRVDPFYIWAHVMGVKEGDSLRFIARGGGGDILASELFRITEDKTIFSANIGVEPSDGGYDAWPNGTYQGTLAFYRSGKEIARKHVAFDLPIAKQ